MQSGIEPRPVVAEKPWAIPLLCAGLAYGGGVLFCIVSLAMMDHKKTAGWGLLLSLLTTLIVAVLDTIAFIGGIVAIVKVQRSASPKGLAPAIAATLLGLVGFFGVFLLLLSSTLYEYSPR